MLYPCRLPGHFYGLEMMLLGQANDIHSLASATFLNYMRVGSTIIRLHSWGQYSKICTLHLQPWALLHPQIGATPLKFEPNQLEAGRLSSMRALTLNYECSLHGLIVCTFTGYVMLTKPWAFLHVYRRIGHKINEICETFALFYTFSTCMKSIFSSSELASFMCTYTCRDLPKKLMGVHWIFVTIRKLITSKRKR